MTKAFLKNVKSNRHKAFLDPKDPTRAYIGNIVLYNVHLDSLCQGGYCVIHNPSQHIMSDLPLHWRGDRGIFERICKHGTGHLDPDNAAYLRSIGRTGEGIHGCCPDNCCMPPLRGGMIE